MKQITPLQGITTACIAVAGLLTSAATSLAVILPQGTPEPGLPTTGAPITFTNPPVLLADITTAFSAPGNLFTGTIRSVAFDTDGAGPNTGLTFGYQVTNTSTNTVGGPEFIDRASLFSFGFGATPNVDFVPAGTTGVLGSGTVTTIDADRNLTGNRVSFDFEFAPGLQNGSTSRFFYVSTNNPSFTNGTANLIGAGIAVASPVLVPVPEPTTVLFGVALMGVLGSRGMRRKLS